MTTLKIYHCDDGNGPMEIEAKSAEDAACEYVDGGDWGEHDHTIWVHVWVTEGDGERERYTISLDPRVPQCSAPMHRWERPHEIVGGLVENPGVWGHGGGVTIHEVCAHCGVHCHRDTWATDPQTGEQGLNSVRYETT